MTGRAPEEHPYAKSRTAEFEEARKKKLNGGHGPGEAFFDQRAPPDEPAPPPSRDDLLLSAWLKRQLPLRDFLMGGVACTTSRWLIFGETGIGKTLLGADMGAGMASGRGFLDWTGQRAARVMYLDGEMPAETFQERIRFIAKRYGEGLPLWGYNRDVLTADDMPPLNTPEGQNWLRREMETVKPDAIIFDSIMALLIGSMSDEEGWAPMKPFVRELSARHVGQFWLHHANDLGKSFGTKTRLWEMDTIVSLSGVSEEEAHEGLIRLQFEKARLRTSANAEQFRPLILRCDDDGWHCENAPRNAGSGRPTAVETLGRQYLTAYDRLADGVEKTHGLDFNLVRKVNVNAIRDELKNRGFLDVDDEGRVTAAARRSLCDAKTKLLGEAKLVESEGVIWRP